MSEHLSLLSTAPDGIQKLRSLILELAVRGKLVAQDPADESASELLKRIAQERERLKAVGTCKKSKSLLPVGGGVLYPLPNNWAWSTLDPLVRVMDSGWSPACMETASPSDEVWGVLKTTAVQTFQYLEFENKELPSHLAPRPDCEVASGDILITRAGPKNRVGISCLVETTRPRLMISDKIIRFHLVEGGMYEKFVALCLNSGATAAYLEASKSGMAASQMNITQEKLRMAPIPICSTAEQKRIVARVDELMALCDRLEAEQTDADAAHAKLVDTLLGTLTQSTDTTEVATNWQRLAEHFDTLFTTESSLDTLKQTILQLAVMGKLVPQDRNDEPACDLFKRIIQERARLEATGACKKLKPMVPVKEDERTFKLPGTWEWVRFGSIADTRLGKMLDAAKNRGQLKPYLRNTNVQWWRFDLDDIKEMRLADDELHEFSLKKGDLLICEGGEPGRCAIWRSELDEMYFQKALHRARPFGGVLSEYLQLVLRQNAVAGVLSSYFTGATIKHFPGDKLNSYVLPLPPVAEQHRIVAKVDELIALCDHLKVDLAESRKREAQLASTLIETALEAA